MTLQELAGKVAGRVARDGNCVFLSYGRNGYVRLFINGERVHVAPVLRRAKGGSISALRERLWAAGIEVAP
jgi:hypothetical protein